MINVYIVFPHPAHFSVFVNVCICACVYARACVWLFPIQSREKVSKKKKKENTKREDDKRLSEKRNVKQAKWERTMHTEWLSMYKTGQSEMEIARKREREKHWWQTSEREHDYRRKLITTHINFREYLWLLLLSAVLRMIQRWKGNWSANTHVYSMTNVCTV